MLQYLRTKAETARQDGDRSPLTFHTDAGFIEMAIIRCHQDRQNGAAVGFEHLEKFLTEREAELREKIERIKQQERERHE